MSIIFKIFIYAMLFITSINAYAASKATYFQLNNMSPYTISSIKIDAVDSYDWDGDSRPDLNLDGKGPVYYLQSIREREEINTWAKGNPFDFTINFSNKIPAIKLSVNMADCNNDWSRSARLADNDYVIISQDIHNDEMILTVTIK